MSDKRRIITLTSDFGPMMGYVGQMKGAILNINREVQIVDLSHGVPPQEISVAALILEQSAPYFPAGTIHVCIVDPEVGTNRPAIIVATSKAFFIGPDNGIFGWLARTRQIKEVFAIENAKYFLDTVSSTFHGRDIFAPVAAYVSMGYPLDEFGRRVQTVMVASADEVGRDGDDLVGCIVAVDSFGNLITSFSNQDLEMYRLHHVAEDVMVSFKDVTIAIHTTFTDVQPGEILCYVGSSGRLEVAINRGNAANALAARIGDQIRLVAVGLV